MSRHRDIPRENHLAAKRATIDELLYQARVCDRGGNHLIADRFRARAKELEDELAAEDRAKVEVGEVPSEPDC